VRPLSGDAVPEISRFFGIVIQMCFDDHPPPHLHAIYAGIEAQVRIGPFCLMGGSLQPRALAMVAEWATVHRTELLDKWSRARAGTGLVRIPPLE
jgi:hypothetical protein